MVSFLCSLLVSVFTSSELLEGRFSCLAGYSDACTVWPRQSDGCSQSSSTAGEDCNPATEVGGRSQPHPWPDVAAVRGHCQRNQCSPRS